MQLTKEQVQERIRTLNEWLEAHKDDDLYKSVQAEWIYYMERLENGDYPEEECFTQWYSMIKSGTI